LRRQDEDGCAIPALPGAPQDVETTSPRQPEIEQHDVVGLARHRQVGRLAISHPVDRVPLLLQAAAHALAEHRVVFDQEEAHRLLGEHG
jgi:hypothetical protein